MSATDPNLRRKSMMRCISKSDREKASLRRSTTIVLDSGSNVVNFRADFSVGFGPSAANSKDDTSCIQQTTLSWMVRVVMIHKETLVRRL